MQISNMANQHYTVTGMHCVSCSNIIKKKLGKLPGISAVDVNFATEKASISYSSVPVSTEVLNKEIDKLGYTLTPTDTIEKTPDIHAGHMGESQTQIEKQKELDDMVTKVYFVLPLTLLLFGIMMWEIATKLFVVVPVLPIPMSLMNTISFLIASVVMFWIGKPFIDGVLKFITYRVANMDTLIGIGTLTAYLYSSIILLFPPVQKLLNAPQTTFFDVTIVVIGFVTLGKYLEARSKQKTGEAIQKLLHLQAKTALVRKGDLDVEVPIDQVVIGDLIVVKPGAKIPVDGIIVEGNSSVDESMVTGESFPQDKKRGDAVIGGTINKQGYIVFRAEKIGRDTLLARIIALVEESSGSKAEIQKLADTVSSIFVPVVLVIAVTAFVMWLVLGTMFLDFSQALSYGILAFVGILVIACPCALGLATPSAIIVGVGKGAEKGILIKNAESLEKLHTITRLVFDKTGTITNGKPIVTDIVSLDTAVSEKELLSFAVSLEQNSQHPLAGAIVEAAKKRKIGADRVTNFKETEGVGVAGMVGEKNIVVRRLYENEKNLTKAEELLKKGKTVIAIEVHKKIIGIIAVSDTIKSSVKTSIAKLHRMNIETVLLTGDNAQSAEFIARQAGIKNVTAEVLPHEKAEMIRKLQSGTNIVAMVGDGINDTPALAQADVSIAMSTGTDSAIEVSDITILNGDIAKVPQAVILSKVTMRTVKQNLFWAFIYNIIGIPVAGGILYPFLGIFLNPMFAGLAMAASSVSVVSNSLLLKKVRI